MILSLKLLLPAGLATYATTTISGNVFTVIAASIGAAGAIVAALIALHLTRKVQEVHVLVNSRLTDVLAELEEVKVERDRLDRRGDTPDRRQASDG